MRRLAAGLLALIVLISCAAVYAASGGESLITQTYLEETYVPGVLEQAQARVEEKTQSIYQSASSVLEGRHSAYLNGGSSASALTDYRFKEGDVLTLPAGSGVLLLAGGASVSTGTLVDVTAGTALSAGAALTARHRGLAAEGGGTVTVTSDTAVLSLEGTYTIVPGSGVDYNALADALRDMGLFQGTGTAYGSGYDLEVAPTRLVGLVMFLRLIGEEGAALSSTAANPFVDTPAWCDRYVAYAYEQTALLRGQHQYHGGGVCDLPAAGPGLHGQRHLPGFHLEHRSGSRGGAGGAHLRRTHRPEQRELPAGTGGLPVLLRPARAPEGRQRHPAGQDGGQQRRGQEPAAGRHGRRGCVPPVLNIRTQ